MTSSGQTTRSRLGLAVRVACGNFLEMYDFMVFGYYAAAIGRAFFPTGDAIGSLLLALTTFGAGFLMRPLGALVLGAYVDRIGVRRGLVLTLALMGFGTLTLACTPGYAAIGLAAPILVLAGRLLQGFSAGVELGSTSVFLADLAPPGQRGLYVSLQSASQQVAVIVAASLGVVLEAWLSPARMDAWGWRIPLLIGCAIVPFLFVLRRSLARDETAHAPSRSPLPMGAIMRRLLSAWRVVLVGVLMVVMTTSAFYLITAYTPSFGRSVLHLSSRASLVVTLCVGLSNLVWLPLAGALTDRIGRRSVLIATTLLTILTAYPAMHWLVGHASFTHLLMVELWLSFLYGSYNGAMVVFLTEFVPPDVRNSGFSMAYSLATCIGGFTPAACTWLIQQTGNRAVPGMWLTGAACCGLLAALLARPRVGREIGAVQVPISVGGRRAS